MNDSLTFLGTGDSMGVPRVYCDCEICTEARITGNNRRLRSSVILSTSQGSILIDCGPDWVNQMESLHQRELGHTLITHAHFDHIGGLPEWADACRWTFRKGNVHAPADVLQTINRQYPWLENHLAYHEVDNRLFFGGWSIQPWKVCHGKNGFSYAYRFSKQQFNWVYCPDSIRLNVEEKKPLYGLDLLILGTNFFKEDADPTTRSVYDMCEAVELIEETRPKRVIFTHMSHGVDINSNYPLPSNVTLAKTGTFVNLI